LDEMLADGHRKNLMGHALTSIKHINNFNIIFVELCFSK
jgi:hypothetical protein